MTAEWLPWAGVAVMAVSLFLIPLGIPGAWIMVAVLLGGAVMGWVPWMLFAFLTLLALVAEILEYLLLKKIGARYGGSSKAFWGAVGGGILGVLIGMPVPLVGPVIAGFVGTFLGAALVTLAETRSARSASRVGWGALLARVLAAGIKTGVGVVVLVAGGAALIV